MMDDVIVKSYTIHNKMSVTITIDEYNALFAKAYSLDAKNEEIASLTDKYNRLVVQTKTIWESQIDKKQCVVKPTMSCEKFNTTGSIDRAKIAGYSCARWAGKIK